jgi:DNA-binding transcriptional LysR family regulator
MDARQLRFFLSVVEHGGITRAAASLHVAQPSLSHSIKQLERELRGELFVRTTRGVQLTAAGRSLVEPARQVLRDLMIARDCVSDVLGLRAGTLDVVAVPALAIDPLSQMVGRYRQRFPDVRVRVADPEDVDDPAALVRSGECEIGLVENVAGDELEVYELESQEVVLVLPPGSPVAAGPVSWGELAQYEFVTSPLGRSVSRSRLEQIFADTGRELRICVESDHRTAIADFVMAGAGAALLRRPIAEGMRERGARVRDLEPAITHRVRLIHRRDVLGPAARAFVTLGTGGVEGRARRTAIEG